MLARRLTVFCLGVTVLIGGRAHAGPIVYSQPSTFPNGTASGGTSQDDPGSGTFAISYDNFVLGTDTLITDVHWTGGYFNPETQGAIQSFTIGFWSDSAGEPGGLLSSQTIAGTAGESFVGSLGTSPFGQLIYSYSLDLTAPFLASGGTTYWLSIVPTLEFPPQWGWFTGTGGDGISYTDFTGTRFTRDFDFAFDLTTRPVPEPASLALLGLGVASVIARKRVRRSRA